MYVKTPVRFRKRVARRWSQQCCHPTKPREVHQQTIVVSMLSAILQFLAQGVRRACRFQDYRSMSDIGKHVLSFRCMASSTRVKLEPTSEIVRLYARLCGAEQCNGAQEEHRSWPGRRPSWKFMKRPLCQRFRCPSAAEKNCPGGQLAAEL